MTCLSRKGTDTTRLYTTSVCCMIFNLEDVTACIMQQQQLNVNQSTFNPACYSCLCLQWHVKMLKHLRGVNFEDSQAHLTSPAANKSIKRESKENALQCNLFWLVSIIRSGLFFAPHLLHFIISNLKAPPATTMCQSPSNPWEINLTTPARLQCFDGCQFSGNIRK